MTRAAADRHMLLEDLLIQGRILGSLTEESDDALSEEMAELWYQMDSEEREAAKARVERYARALAKGVAQASAGTVSSNFMDESQIHNISAPKPLLTVLTGGRLLSEGGLMVVQFTNARRPVIQHSVM